MRGISFSRKYEDVLVTGLRLTIAGIFIWFGVLKILGYNPVYDLIYYSAVPFFAAGAGLLALGVFETLIGVMLLSNRAIYATHAVLVLHLVGTFSTFIFGWDIVFEPFFPVLTLGGEFVVKNIVLALSGLMVLVHESRRNTSSTH